MSHHIRAGDRIFSDWHCPECAEDFSTNRHVDVEVVYCPQCRWEFRMAPIKEELARVLREHIETP